MREQPALENLVQSGDAGRQPLRGFWFWHGVLLAARPSGIQPVALYKQIDAHQERQHPPGEDAQIGRIWNDIKHVCQLDGRSGYVTAVSGQQNRPLRTYSLSLA